MCRFIVLLFLVYSTPMRAQLSYIAHRGASYLAPENTIAAINLAWQLESDGAECDVMLTKDNKVILFHDRDGKRLLDRNLIIRNTKYRDLKKLPIKLKETNQMQYKGSKIPLLKKILRKLPPNQLLVIEIKDELGILPHLSKVIEKFWTSGNIVFIAFHYETIVATKKMFPHVPCYYLSSSLKDINERFEVIAKSRLDGVDLNYKIVSPELVDRFRKINKEVWCWTVNSPDDALKMQRAGIKYITTDRPKWLRDEVRQHEPGFRNRANFNSFW